MGYDYIIMGEFIVGSLRALMHVCIFIPYFGNVREHSTHLFSPWKRIIVQDKGWIDRVIGNIFSRIIGAIMRGAVIVVTITVLAIYLLLLPFFAIFIVVISPLALITSALARSNKHYDVFMRAHCLNDENRIDVDAWYETIIQEQKKGGTFSLSNLLSITPIGYDWNYGFTPTLDQYAFSVPFRSRKIIGRESEVNACLVALARSDESNVLLIGPEGVGRRTLVEYIGQKIQDHSIPSVLHHYRLLELDMHRVIASSPEYAAQVTLLDMLFDEAYRAGNCILVVFDIERYTSHDEGDFSSVFEKYAQRKGIKFIGVTTPHALARTLVYEERLVKLFHHVAIESMTKDRALNVLLSAAYSIEQATGIIIPYETVTHVLERCDRIMSTVPFPEKGIITLSKSAQEARNKGTAVVTDRIVDEVLESSLHVPVGSLHGPIALSLQELLPQLTMSVLGQESAMNVVASTISKAMKRNVTKKPRASMLFLGPTGVGKTQTAKVLAASITGDERNMVRLDMGFYQTRESHGSFIELLAQGVRSHPFSIILIDEIEKADKNALNTFLTLLDEGYVIDQKGEKVDCRHSIVIATSNAASEELYKNTEIDIRDYVVAKGIFSPEFLNRFDALITFAPINKAMAYEIALHKARALQNDARKEGKVVSIDTAVLKREIELHYDPRFGARDVERVVLSVLRL